MPSASRIEKARKAMQLLLSESPEVTALTGERIASGWAAKNWAENPQSYIVYKLDNTQGAPVLNGPAAALWGPTFVVHCWGKNKTEADRLADAAMDWLEAVPINRSVDLGGGVTLRLQAVSVQEDPGDQDGPPVQGQAKPENCTLFTVILWHEG